MSSTSASSPAPSASWPATPSVPSSLPTIAESVLLSATLLLLLSVSAAIVIRSYVLRRRQRLLIDAAIRNGTYVPGLPRTLFPGAKPRLYDAFLAPPPDPDLERAIQKARADAGDPEEKQSSLWERIMVRRCVPPRFVSRSTDGRPAHLLKNHLAPCSGSPPVTPPGDDPHILVVVPHEALRPNPNHRSPAPSPSPPPPTPPHTPSTPPAQQVSVAVLIAMPAPHTHRPPHAHSHSSADETLPYVEFGVAQVPLAASAQAS
ncbi:hypothetical protein A0H81_03035 [Grifola frondosa]|uniref:Uncharacterized protein n=1 Tax=Grifola frondosa TaxID=5627 RepID=A0A1C7MIW9_GRIFR|nr:hypothetical protein A0H81_03035 [Grifola frondosa]